MLNGASTNVDSVSEQRLFGMHAGSAGLWTAHSASAPIGTSAS